MAATVTQTDVNVPLKLVVNKERNKVLFAEAGKDFVDVLFSFLTMPLGTIARLVEKKSNMEPVTVGCLNLLYNSVANLDESMWTQTCKEILLQSRNSSEDYCNTLKLNIDDSEPKKYLRCNYDKCNSLYLGPSTTQQKCGCGNSLTRTVFLKHFCNGFVNAVATFLITDDLTVMPNSLDYTTFALLQNFGIESPSSVKEMTVNVTKDKVLDLLKCSLLCKSSLTHLFLEKKLVLDRSRVFSCSVENSSMSSIEITLKLVIRKSNGRILYAQGEKDFADLLLSFLTFPLGGVVRRLGGNCSMGNIDELYKSIVDLNENIYLVSKEAKGRLVDHHLIPQFSLRNQILPMIAPEVWQCYCDNESIPYVQFFKNEHTSRYCKRMHLAYHGFEGCVKGPAMYVATDDLVVAPFSPISALNLLNRLNTPFNDLREKVVTIGIKECLSILKASLTSTSALNNGLGHLLTTVKEEK